MKDGGPAFPDIRGLGANGMTLRDYFAAKAMEGQIARDEEAAGARIKDISEYAYRIADAMLAERDKGRVE